MIQPFSSGNLAPFPQYQKWNDSTMFTNGMGNRKRGLCNPPHIERGKFQFLCKSNNGKWASLNSRKWGKVTLDSLNCVIFERFVGKKSKSGSIKLVLAQLKV
jgi:hypothetical protein